MTKDAFMARCAALFDIVDQAEGCACTCYSDPEGSCRYCNGMTKASDAWHKLGGELNLDLLTLLEMVELAHAGAEWEYHNACGVPVPAAQQHALLMASKRDELARWKKALAQTLDRMNYAIAMYSAQHTTRPGKLLLGDSEWKESWIPSARMHTFSSWINRVRSELNIAG